MDGFICPECHRTFSDQEELESHWISQHRQTVEARVKAETEEQTRAAHASAATAAAAEKRRIAVPAWMAKISEAAKGQAKDIDQGMDKLRGTIVESWQASLSDINKIGLSMKAGMSLKGAGVGGGGSGGSSVDDEAILVEEMERIREESRQTCILIFKEHLDEFLREAPKWPAPTYEAWIRDLHPENARSKRGGTQQEGEDGDVDHRFYLPDSDHLVQWNKHPSVNEANRVKPRPSGARVAPAAVIEDLLDFGAGDTATAASAATAAPEAAGGSDLLGQLWQQQPQQQQQQQQSDHLQAQLRAQQEHLMRLRILLAQQQQHATQQQSTQQQQQQQQLSPQSSQQPSSASQRQPQQMTQFQMLYHQQQQQQLQQAISQQQSGMVSSQKHMPVQQHSLYQKQGLPQNPPPVSLQQPTQRQPMQPPSMQQEQVYKQPEKSVQQPVQQAHQPALGSSEWHNSWSLGLKQDDGHQHKHHLQQQQQQQQQRGSAFAFMNLGPSSTPNFGMQQQQQQQRQPEQRGSAFSFMNESPSMATMQQQQQQQQQQGRAGVTMNGMAPVTSPVVSRPRGSSSGNGDLSAALSEFDPLG